ncbi:DUF5686 and carboxypeptidase-like regulatory domain-containing protein [Mangrovibacterium marinum]|uniref:Carboxypeptidase-like protein n=1 Tax=Mangrovibacterium marinum TaxID=1639118 RepID=A0A2T5C3V0_9BACT|nr:DUF5686 and carboxypeptidase-like regulatory domain-containing protein [Mangrovibacterium marinum]PTN09493.1 carboxypeptidase-like protein [Mangrovibacterium marinum]
MLRIFAIAIFMAIVSSGVFGQSVSGVVREADSNESIPFANIWIKGTLQGTQSELDGRFTIPAPKGDTLVVSAVGFVQQEFILKRNQKNELTVQMQKDVKKIDEVTVKSDIPFARVVFNQIQKHKKENREKLESVPAYKKLENTTVYIAVDTTAKVSRFFNNMSDVTVSLEGQDMRFSPVYLEELAEDVKGDSADVVYVKKDGIFPRSESFIESFILKNVAVKMDFYDDHIVIMDRGYVSPLSRTALLYYDIYFNDTIYQDGQKYYHLTYAPKNPRNPLFSGSFTVDAENYALSKIEAFISGKANLNFINGFRGCAKYQLDHDGNYFFDAQQVDINMSLKSNKDSAAYSSRRLESVSSGNWLINKTTSYSTSPRLDAVKTRDWKSQPEFALSSLDDETYRSVDKLKQAPIVKNVDKIGGVALTSFYNMGKIDLGPVFDIYSTNMIEGNRFSIPVRTSEQMFERYSIGGFIGYGTKNKEFKFGANFDMQPGKTDKFLFRFRYYNDYNLISQDRFLRFIKHNPNNKGNSNFIAVFTTKEKNPYLKEEKYLEARIEYNSPNDFHLEASPYVNWNYSTSYVSFTKDGVPYEKFTNYGVLVDARFAFGQHYDKYFFDRIYYVDPIPVIDVGVDFGRLSVPGMDGDQGFYARFHSSIQGRILLGQMFVNYMLNGGYLFGDAPFDQLDLPVGSMSLGYAKFRFNLLHHASFAHNAYVNLHSHLNGGGVLLNKIPLIRKLKLREVVSLKAHYGDLTKSYHGVFDLPDFFRNEKNTPYAEIGFGVTNLFKVLRVEYVRQLGSTYRNSDFTYKNGIFFRTEMSF